MKTHFIFDFDDTISGSYEHNQNMFVQTFPGSVIEHHEDLLRQVHRESRGTGMQQFQQVIDQLQLDLDAEVLTAENDQLHLANFAKVTLFNGVHDLLGILKQRGKDVSICTNRQYQSLNALLAHHNLSQYLTHVVSCKDEGHEKPDPQCLLDIIAKEGKPKEDFIYFGDSKTDYEFAANAGIDFVIVDQYLNAKSFYEMIVKAFL